jgi:hypothetical protein
MLTATTIPTAACPLQPKVVAVDRSTPVRGSAVILTASVGLPNGSGRDDRAPASARSPLTARYLSSFYTRQGQ